MAKPTVKWSQFRADKGEKKPWIVTVWTTPAMVSHRYHATEKQARESVGLRGGSDSLGPPKKKTK